MKKEVKIYLSYQLLQDIDFENIKIYLNIPKAKSIIEARLHTLADASKYEVHKNQTYLDETYCNLQFKSHTVYPTVCISVSYKGFYIPLDCFYIKASLEVKES